MQRLAVLLLTFGMMAAPAAEAPKLADLSWLAGAWVTQSARARVEEHWLPPAAGMMLGMSRTYSPARTLSFEFLRIAERDGAIFYIAQPQGRPPTEFKLTRGSSSEALFENPQHDHPKAIRYRVTTSGDLEIELTGTEKTQRFTMARPR